MRQTGNALCRMPRVSVPQRKQAAWPHSASEKMPRPKTPGSGLLTKIELNRFSFFATFPHGFEPLLARLAVG